MQRWLNIYKTKGKLVLKKKTCRNITVRTKKLVKNVKKQLTLKKTPKSTRLLSKKLKVSRTSIQRILKNDLGLKSFVVRKTTALNYSQKKKRIKFVNWVLQKHS